MSSEAGGPPEMAYYFWVVRPVDGSPPTLVDTGPGVDQAARRSYRGTIRAWPSGRT